MDALSGLLIAAFVLAVLGLFAWIFTMLAVTYVLYKYVFVPWKVMRTDVTALAAKMRIVEASMNRNQVMAADDAHAVRAEARLSARARAAQMTGAE